jgi:hypothetical protein
VFLKALLFVKSGYYVNTARVDPALLVVEGSRLRVRDKKSLANCIMTGTLTESFIVESCEAGPRHAPYPVHKVTIAPLDQDWRHDVSVWGLLFNFRVISGLLTEAGFGFATRGAGKGDAWKNGVFILLSTAWKLSLIISASFCSIIPNEKQAILFCFEGGFFFYFRQYRFNIRCFPFIRRPK